MDNFVKCSQIIICALLLISIGLNVYLLTRENQCEVIEKVTTEVVRDTIHDTIPELRYEKLISYKTDTLRVVDIIPGDTVHVVAEIPITQKEYSDDSTYTAWVSGYKQSLDSIDVYKNTVYITKEITKTKVQKFSVGPYIGYGYDFSNKTFGVSVGIGISYKIFGF